jgi:hypothetical protein
MKDVDNDVPCNMSEICRLCLSKDGGILPIFGEEESGNQSVPLSFRILACVSIEASIIPLRLKVQSNCTFAPLPCICPFQLAKLQVDTEARFIN